MIERGCRRVYRHVKSADGEAKLTMAPFTLVHTPCLGKHLFDAGMLVRTGVKMHFLFDVEARASAAEA